MTLDHIGYSSKLMRVLSVVETSDGGLDFYVREEAAAVWDWNLGDETTVDLAPNTTLPDPFIVPQVEGFDLETDEFTVTGGAEITRLKVLWNAPSDQFITFGGKIEIQFRRVNVSVDWGLVSEAATAQADWGLVTESLDSTSEDFDQVPYEPSFLVDGGETEAYISPVEPNVEYDVRARNINELLVQSDWVEELGFVIGQDLALVQLDYGSIANVADPPLLDYGLITVAADSFKDRGSIS